jgi:sarcosine oxidase gamma subunit
MIQRESGFMSELGVLAFATDAAGPLAVASGLRLDELALQINVMAASTPAGLDAGLAKAGLSLGLGQKRPSGDGLLLRFWPDRCWVIGAVAALPAGLALTGISHGQTVLCLRGVEALHFVAKYASADLLVGPYDVTLWWETTRHLCLAVERSLAQSFVDFLRSAAQRQQPEPEPT